MAGHAFMRGGENSEEDRGGARSTLISLCFSVFDLSIRKL